MSDRIETYREFWPFYLREHRKPVTRWAHFFGTSLGLGLGVTALVKQNGWIVPAALVSAYAFAWVSHFTVEKNKPATFRYPLWSFISDFRMMGLMWIGRLGPELVKAGAVTTPALAPHA